jgi:C1A family cysteine protease
MENEFFYRAPSSRSKRLPGILVVALFGIIFTVYTFSKTTKQSLILSEYQLQEVEFNQYLMNFDKSYNSDEVLTRFKTFRDNSAYIRLHNSLKRNWKLGLNQFSDLSHSEFISLLNLKPKTQLSSNYVYHDGDYPLSVDWRSKGVVNPSVDQMFCGSCWAFSAIGAIEAALAIKQGKLEVLSKQQLVDCSSAFGNEGCNGGWMDYAFKYAMKNDIARESDYKYEGEAKTCRINRINSSKPGFRIKGYVDVAPYSVQSLAAAVSTQPVSIAVDASSWQFYSGGVIDSDCGSNLNHATLAVGYSLDPKNAYWIIKNSWGHRWGEDGFLKVAVTEGAGLCGVLTVPSYPIV